jgi:hypothetical protein
MKSGGSTVWPDIVMLALGLPLLLLAMVAKRGKTDFFTQPRVSYDTIE